MVRTENKVQVITRRFCMKFFLLVIDYVNKTEVTMWTPAHVVILSNERTDRLAKETIKEVDIDMQMCKSTENGVR